MVTIIPTIFAKNEESYKERYERVIGLGKEFQVDFMDGKLDTPRGLLPAAIGTLPRDKRFEAHMMVAEPHRYVDLAAEKGFSRYLFHAESQRDENETRLLIDKIHAAGMQAGLVLNPGTPVTRLEPFVKDLDVAMFMGHAPGSEGGGVEPGVYNKLRAVHKKHPRLPLEVDGGVDEESAPKLVRAGATRLSAGSAVSAAEDPKEAMARLKRAGR